MQIKFTNVTKDIQLNLTRVLASGEKITLAAGESVIHPVTALKSGWQTVISLFKEHITSEVVDPVKEAAAAAALAAKAESDKVENDAKTATTVVAEVESKVTAVESDAKADAAQATETAATDVAQAAAKGVEAAVDAAVTEATK